MAETRWNPFNYEDKASTRPPTADLVWIVEEFYEEGVTLGYFDGYTFRTWGGSDDCSVSAWAPIDYPGRPAGKSPLEVQGG